MVVKQHSSKAKWLQNFMDEEDASHLENLDYHSCND